MGRQRGRRLAQRWGLAEAKKGKAKKEGASAVLRRGAEWGPRGDKGKVVGASQPSPGRGGNGHPKGEPESPGLGVSR